MISRFLLLAAAFRGETHGPETGSGAPTETVVVYGTLPNSDIGLSPDKVAGSLQSLSADSHHRRHGATVLERWAASTAGVRLSDTQGNSMFEDLRYHGFEASPLQGTAQGVAVYQNGVRLNEAFGDTVNWDAIPQAAIARMDVWSNNPVFGLNALGGAVNLVMKNGFTWQGGEASLQGGSYGHGMATAEYGLRTAISAFMAPPKASPMAAGGCIPHPIWAGSMPMPAGGLEAAKFHLVASGAAIRAGRGRPHAGRAGRRIPPAVYTWPQTTQNRVGSLALNGKTKLGDHWQLEASAYVRTLRQRHVDGNDGNFESCSSKSSFGGDLACRTTLSAPRQAARPPPSATSS